MTALELAQQLVGLVLDDDHKRLCEGRNYTCECGYDVEVQEAAERLDAALSAQASLNTGEVSGG